MNKGLLISLLSIILFTSCEQKKVRHIRKNANNIECKKDLEDMDKAMQIMRKMDCSNPLSYYYQGAIHWIPDTINNNPLCKSYQNVSDLKDAWDNCTHTPSGKEKMHFLIWHRLYIYYFERIVRKLSGDENFALPYWGYTNTDSLDKVMPMIFRDKNSSLYESCRFHDLNEGKPISGEILRALDLTKLNNYKTYKMYCMNINSAPHGAMHDYIGAGNDTTGLLQFQNPITNSVTNTGLMGWVPTAGFDPIFWLHHSNIDRIWQQWTNSENGVMPTLEDLKDSKWSYVFYDENGKRIEFTVEQALDTCFKLDYDFDDTKVNPKEMKLLSNTNDTQKVLGTLDARIEVKNKKHVLGKIHTLLSNKKPTVELEITVSYTKIPKGIYEVYVNQPENQEFKTNGEYFAGYMTFFGSDHKMSGKSCEKGCCRPLTKEGRPTQTFVFEVKQNEDYIISIYKSTSVSTGDLKVENVKIKQ